MEDEEFINPNFIVTQKINQIGKVLNELKEKQSDLLINNLTNSQNASDYVKLELIKQQADQDVRNFSQQIQIIQEENKDRVLFIRKPISSFNYQPENEKKYKQPTIQCQVQKLENTYKDLYFGSDLISECLKEEQESLPLTKRRSNGSVLIQKDANSYEYVYTNYQTNCLQGVQFNLNRNLLSNHYSIDITNQIEYNPLKKSSAILGLNKILIDENEYLQVRSIYNLHFLKMNDKKKLSFKGVESNFFQDFDGNSKELLDSAQSTFFEEELYVLAEGNSLFKTTDLGKTNQHFHLKNLKSNIESIDTSYHPSILYLQMTDCIGQFDFRQNNPRIIHQVPTKKVPLHRIYALKNLEENYFMVSTTQHFKIYDIRCTNYPVFSVMHGSDECPPTIINIYPNKNDNLEDNSEEDDAVETLLMQDGSMRLSKQRGTEKIIVSYSPYKKSDITYMRWNKGSTLLESLYEKKSQAYDQQNLYTPKNSQKRDLQKNNYFKDEKSQYSDDNNKYMFSQSKGSDFNFQYLSQKERKGYDNSYSNNDESLGSYKESSGINIKDNNNDSISEEGNKNLQKHHILGRENKGERLCFSQEVKNLFQPKSILASSQISDTLKIRGVSIAFFDDQEKFICIQNDSKGGVQTQIFSKRSDDSPLTSTFVPIKAKSSQTSSLVDISKSDPQLNSISDLQVMKLFELPDISDNYSTKGDLITEPVRLSKQKKKQVNMYPYFNFLQDQVKTIKEQNVEEINRFINIQKEKKQKFQQQQSAKSGIETLVNSQLSAINVAETVSNDQIKETIMEQNNLLSVYHDKYSYPEFRKNMKYNTKNVITNKIIEVLGDYWD
ncbi:hypothetical protein TTHERM_00762920 (macronuclear) [Tetrahymena thermophila SB210]|uniref:Uncharacterized protein n=1 Tax=Tetrahymena thermophila (strain SB210) TaxID=312017 RepID=I7LXP7_TETTS|nr:hypothetical protein TTHERM_00762920 [Tetrahymena thermophila SB210]EAS05105.2 hypothetical protein TTHERM_00762920 [Tetrahymena thermophila SB210]|eukprot:XP_001025350.2 hypothetical protein TTHERM_00762920 [Tetrahymena thermophila SB210]